MLGAALAWPELDPRSYDDGTLYKATAMQKNGQDQELCFES